MNMSMWKRRAVMSLVVFAFLFAVTGCGYYMKPARRTEKLSNEVDPTTVICDAAWLLAFIVPGVVALSVDAIYETWYFTADELKTRNARE